MGSLNEYIDLNRDNPFQWKKLDCIHFVCRGVNFMGSTFFEDEDDWQYVDERSAKRCVIKLYKKHGVKDLPSLLDKHYNRLPHYPVEGCIVAKPVDYDSTTGYLLGFVSGRHGVYVGEQGLTFLPSEPDTEIYWRFN